MITWNCMQPGHQNAATLERWSSKRLISANNSRLATRRAQVNFWNSCGLEAVFSLHVSAAIEPASMRLIHRSPSAAVNWSKSTSKSTHTSANRPLRFQEIWRHVFFLSEANLMAIAIQSSFRSWILFLLSFSSALIVCCWPQKPEQKGGKKKAKLTLKSTWLKRATDPLRETNESLTPLVTYSTQIAHRSLSSLPIPHPHPTLNDFFSEIRLIFSLSLFYPQNPPKCDWNYSWVAQSYWEYHPHGGAGVLI